MFSFGLAGRIDDQIQRFRRRGHAPGASYRTRMMRVDVPWARSLPSGPVKVASAVAIWLPRQRVSLVEALAGFTTGAAHAGFAEDRIGSLAPGHYADFILIDRDIFAACATQQQVREAQVLETWVGGERLWTRASR
jgi:imidazolonepropionase-like amidohydrolase